MSRPPRNWFAEVAELVAARPEFAGIGLTAAAEVVTA